MRRIAVIVPALLLGAAVAVSAQDWRAGIDSRVELMSILFRLAGNQEYRQCRVPAYDQAIEEHFAPYHDHDAVQFARSLRIGFDGPLKIAVSLRDIETLNELAPLERLHLSDSWNAAKAHDFIAAVRRFVADSHFQDFLTSQQPLYSATNTRLQSFIRDKADLQWFDRFFEPSAPARMVIVPGLANGAPSYAARGIDAAGRQEIYAVPGVSKVDSSGVPVFDNAWRTVMVHEFANVLVSQPANQFADKMERPAAEVYAHVASAMQRQSYGNWRSMVYQSLVRAAAIEYVIEHDGEDAARIEVRRENAKSFYWMGELVDLFESYRKDRVHFPSFELFMPRVVEFFENLAPRVVDLVDRSEPRVVSTSIADGARDVDPAVKSIVVYFSLPMSRGGPDKTARDSGSRFDPSGTVLTLPVTLEPDRDYVIPLRWSGGQSFVSAEGVPLPATLLKFRTASTSSMQKQ